MMPDITLGYSHQFVMRSFDPAGIERDYFPGTRMAGFQLGVALPVFNRAGRARVKSEEIAAQLAEVNYQRIAYQHQIAYQQTLEEYSKNKIGRAHVSTPDTNAQLVCSNLIEKKQSTTNHIRS